MAGVSTSCRADEAWTPFTTADSFTYSGPVTIREYLHKWHGPLEDDGNALTFNWAEAGVRYGRFSISYVDRYDYEIKASPGAARLYYQVQNRQNLSVGTDYDLDVRAFHHRSWGVRTAWDFHPLSQLDLEAGLTALRGESLEAGTIGGTANATAPKTYDYNAEVYEFYSRDYLFKRVVSKPPRGVGASLDLSFRWQALPHLSVYGQGRDIYGFIHWYSTPYTRATATSDTKQYDSSGYVQFRPTLSGFEGTASYRQVLKPHGTVGLDWEGNDRVLVGSKVFVTDIRPFWTLLARRRFFDELWLGVEAMPLQKAGGFDLQWRQLKLSALSDGLNPGAAHVLSARFDVAWTFP